MKLTDYVFFINILSDVTSIQFVWERKPREVKWAWWHTHWNTESQADQYSRFLFVIVAGFSSCGELIYFIKPNLLLEGQEPSSPNISPITTQLCEGLITKDFQFTKKHEAGIYYGSFMHLSLGFIFYVSCRELVLFVMHNYFKGYHNVFIGNVMKWGCRFIIKKNHLIIFGSWNLIAIKDWDGILLNCPLLLAQVCS